MRTSVLGQFIVWVEETLKRSMDTDCSQPDVGIGDG